MKEAVKPAIDLDYPGKDGTTLREHLQSYCRQAKTWDDRLDPPDLPQELIHLWQWFWEVVGGMGESGFWLALDAWRRNTGNELESWEADVMAQLHAEYQKAISAKMREK